MTKKILIILLVVIVLGAGGAYLAANKTSNTDTKTTTTPATTENNTTTGNNSSTPNNTESPAVAATITYSDSGFSPATTTVHAGDTVAIKNISSHDVQFDSDPHPVHTDDTDLNAGLVSPGQTLTFRVEKTGTFGYHNHLNPTQTGTIVIE